MKYYLLSLLLWITLTGCRGKTTPVITEKINIEGIPEYYLTMDTILRLRDPFPPEIYSLNDSLVAITYYRDGTSLRICNINQRNIENYQLRKESDRFTISSDPYLNNSLPLYNKANGIFYNYTVENGILRIENFTRLRIGKASPKQCIQIAENLFIGIGEYTKGLLGIINTQTNEITYTGSYPIKEPKYHSKEFLHLYNGHLDVYNNRLVYGAEFFGFISSYEYRKGKIYKVWEKQLTDFVYTGRLNRIELDSTHCYGFQDIIVREKYTYGLYTGYSDNSRTSFTNSVLLFSHDGNPICRCYFSDMMSEITVDHKEEYIYATFSPFMNQSMLVRYKIPSLE